MKTLTPGGFDWAAVTLRDILAFHLIDLVAGVSVLSEALLLVNCFTLGFAFGLRKTFLVPERVLLVFDPMKSADTLLDRVLVWIA